MPINTGGKMQFRTAQIGDEKAIQRLKECVWPDETTRSERIRSVLNDPQHHTTAAVVDEDTVGFVDSFLTVSATGILRWEVDLLAVHPEYRRQGIATRLIERSIQTGLERGAELARGLVQVDNTSSQRAFARNAFTTDGIVCHLYVAFSSVAQPSVQPSAQLHIVDVNTMNYAGIWLEDCYLPEAFVAAIERLAHNKVDVAGAVIPSNEPGTIEAAWNAGFEFIGHYHWWQRKLK